MCKAQLHNAWKSNTFVSPSQEKSILRKNTVTSQRPRAFATWLLYGWTTAQDCWHIRTTERPFFPHDNVNPMMSFPNKVSLLANGCPHCIISLCLEGSFISYNIATLELIWER